MQRPKMIALDLDGTLLHDSRISQKNADAVKACMALGVHVVVATGRIPVAAWRHLEPHGLRLDIVASNGAQVMTAEGECLSVTHLDGTAALKILQAADEKHAYLYVLLDEALYLVRSRDEAEFFARKYADTLGARPVREFLFHSAQEAAPHLHQLQKVVVIDGFDKDWLYDLRKFAEKDLPELCVTSSWHDNIELMANGVSKAAGLSIFTQRYGIHPEEMMAMGDSENDIPMLEYAGLGVAMGNAVDLVKAHADFVAPTCMDDGVAYALQKFVIGEHER